MSTRPELSALRIADPPARWSALGFTVLGETITLGGVGLVLGGQGDGITGWSVGGIAGHPTIDGLPAIEDLDGAPASAAGEHAAVDHPNGAVGLDHVVVTTPNFDRTTAALEAAGMPLRRVRAVGEGDGTFRQGFRRLGPAILELVEARHTEDGKARFWGLVVIVSDLDALAARLGARLSAPKPAVQPGRRIATLRRTAGLSPAVAFMSPE